MEYTKGPWHVGTGKAERIVYAPNGYAVASATTHHGLAPVPEMAQNARLIAAAPDLLEALEGFLQVGMSIRADSIIWSEARAAIAKARGE